MTAGISAGTLAAISLGSAAIGAGGSIGAAALSRGGGGGGGGQMPLIWPEWQTAPQYPWSAGLLGESAGFIQDNIARMRKGEYPDYFQNALPQLRTNLTRPLRETYYGRPGERQGVLQGAYELGSIAGLGPANVGARVSSALLDYATKESQIDEYLTKIGVDIMREDAGRFPQLAINMPQGPSGAFLSPYSPPAVVQGGGSGQALMQSLGAGIAGIGGQLANNYFNQTPNYSQGMFNQPALNYGNVGGSQAGNYLGGSSGFQPLPLSSRVDVPASRFGF